MRNSVTLLLICCKSLRNNEVKLINEYGFGEKFRGPVYREKMRKQLWYELSGKKRKQGISRFCHQAEELLVKNSIVRFGNDLYTEEI